MLKVFKDHLDNKVQINFPPQRIISIVPSQTELLFDLGLDKEIVGVTKFCVHPEDKFKQKIKVGGTKALLMDVIDDLQPDLIIGNKEENSQNDILLLQKKYPVWMSDIYTLDDSIKTINDIAEIVNRAAEASYINFLINSGFKDLKKISNLKSTISVAYCIWKNPYMFAGHHTFIDDLMSRVGFKNVIKTSRYPEVTIAALKELNPDYIFLSSEPYPFKEKHIPELQTELPNTKIILVDGEMFSWYGSRLIKAVQYFFELQKIVK